MKFFHLKRTRSRLHHSQRYPLYAVLVLLLVALAVLAFVWVKKDGAEKKVQLARNNIVSTIHADLIATLRAYDKVSLPKPDLSGEILPDMRKHLYAARVENRVMRETYGEGIADDALLGRVDDAIDQVEHMLSLGQSTSASVTALGTVLGEMQEQIEARYADGSLRLSVTALK